MCDGCKKAKQGHSENSRNGNPDRGGLSPARLRAGFRVLIWEELSAFLFLMATEAQDYHNEARNLLRDMDKVRWPTTERGLDDEN